MSIMEEIIFTLFKIKDYKLKSIKRDKSIILELERSSPRYCRECGKECRIYDSSYQTFYLGSLNSEPVYAVVKVARVKCVDHGVKTEFHGITNGKRRYTQAVADTVIQYTQLLDNESTAKLLGISKSTVYRIDTEVLSNAFLKYQKSIPSAEHLCVDETSYQRGHKYATIISDHKTGKVLWVEKDRKESSLSHCYQAINSILKGVKAVSMDLWKAFENATKIYIPKALIVYDKFHLSRILNRYVEEQRRSYQHYLSDKERLHIKKHTRWVLLKRQRNHSLSDSMDLEKLKMANETLFELYLLKESFLEIFDYSDTSRKQAAEEIRAWIKEVNKTDFECLKRFAKATEKRLHKMLNWFDCPISNGKAEGVNNSIKTLFKRAYGYKDFDYMKLKILQKNGYLMKYV